MPKRFLPVSIAGAVAILVGNCGGSSAPSAPSSSAPTTPAQPAFTVSSFVAGASAIGSGRLITTFTHNSGILAGGFPESQRPGELFLPSPEKLLHVMRR